MMGSIFATSLCAFLIAHFSLALTQKCLDSTCKFNLIIHKGRTMTYTYGSAAYNVELVSGKLTLVTNTYHTTIPSNVTLDPDKVITGDGYPRNLFLINGQSPGPTIEVYKGAMVEVLVQNQLNAEILSVHWHGMELYGYPEMDGTAYLNQCPILPGQKFKYRFKANTVGTHWYHSHTATMRLDAFFGFFIVHEGPRVPYNNPPEFTMSVMEWLHVDYDTMIISLPKGYYRPGTGDGFLNEDDADFTIDGAEMSSLVFHSVLVNGRGRHNNRKFPLTLYKVRPMSVYRFRVANTGAEASWDISIDSHELEIIALDGSPIQPIIVHSFIIFPGERVDFRLRTKPQGNGKNGRGFISHTMFYGRKYWIRVVMFREGKGPDVIRDGKTKEGGAILEYVDSSTSEGQSIWYEHYDPMTTPNLCSQQKKCKVFNCPMKSPGYPWWHHKTCINMDAVRYQGVLDKPKYGLMPGFRIQSDKFLNFGFIKGPSVNGISYVHARKPFIFGPSDYSNYITPCNCPPHTPCKCTNIEPLKYGDTQQFVLTNLHPNGTGFAHHPMHFHGHNFAVLKVGYPRNNPIGRRDGNSDDVYCWDSLCTETRWVNGQPALNLNDPPIRDTIVVPAGGYAVIRFKSEMPGYWFLHCHQDEHFVRGMVIVFAEATERIKLPRNFPQCGDFL